MSCDGARSTALARGDDLDTVASFKFSRSTPRLGHEMTVERSRDLRVGKRVLVKKLGERTGRVADLRPLTITSIVFFGM